MPLITEPQLQIDYDRKNRVANIHATCRVVLRPPEDCLVKLCPEAPWYRLVCEIVPVDFGTPITDLRLVWMGSKDLPPLPADTDPPLAFDQAVGASVLNEDIVGRDEVMGLFTLFFKLSDTRVATALTNLWTDSYR